LCLKICIFLALWNNANFKVYSIEYHAHWIAIIVIVETMVFET